MCSLSIIGTVGVPACYGGFETLVENLLDNDMTEKERSSNSAKVKSSQSHISTGYRNCLPQTLSLRTARGA